LASCGLTDVQVHGRRPRNPGEACSLLASGPRYVAETLVRLHRAGEGAPYTGLKPAGLDVGPVIPVAERAIETGSGDELASLLSDSLREEVKGRLDHVLELKARADEDLPQARKYTGAMLGFQVWAHKLHLAIQTSAHETPEDHVG
jgi:uncharacterized protein DUF6448